MDSRKTNWDDTDEHGLECVDERLVLMVMTMSMRERMEVGSQAPCLYTASSVVVVASHFP